MSPPIHIDPTAPLAERVLLPGDPGRALMLAQVLLERPRMFNHNRGLWGYTGTGPDAETLTIQSSGMGGPSAAIVVTELADLGARRIVRVGTCGALDPSLKLGQVLLVGEAMAADGTSRALGAGERVSAPRGLIEAFARAGASDPRTVVSTDLFYDHDAKRPREWRAGGAAAVEMDCATLFTLAEVLKIDAGAVLVVSDLLEEPPQRIGAEELHAAERRMGELAFRALAQI
ncbi:MAG: phosphorylase family protein [Solirubrobacteraceae bacterium]